MEHLVEINLADAALFKESWKNAILGGRINPLEFYRQAKLFTLAIDELKKDGEIMDAAFDEIAKHPKGKAEVGGSVLTEGSRCNYDYSSCNDNTWNELKEKLRQREAFLKAIPAGGVVDPETGEFIMHPSVTVSKFITVK